MAESEKEIFINGERIAEVWAAFLTKLALYVDKKTLEDYPTMQAMATSIASALSDYATSEEVATSITTALENYMTESEVNTAIGSAVSGLSGGLTRLAVDTLPETGEDNIIYLVPNPTPTDKNVRDEYMWLNNAWEIIGNTSIDLSNYWSKEELTPMTAEELAAILV